MFTALSIGHNEMPAVFGSTEEQVSVFAARMVGVPDRRRKIVIEHLDRLQESNAVLLLVVPGFLRVPLEYEHAPLALADYLFLRTAPMSWFTTSSMPSLEGTV